MEGCQMRALYEKAMEIDFHSLFQFIHPSSSIAICFVLKEKISKKI